MNNLQSFILKIYKLLIISNFIGTLIFLSSCNHTTTNGDSPPTPTTTMPPSTQSSFSTISVKNADKINQIRKWESYDVNSIAWSMASSMFAIAGKENRSDTSFGIYAYDIHSPTKLWFSEIYAPFSLVYSPDDRVIAIPFFAGFSLLDPVSGEQNKEVLFQESLCFGSQEIAFSPDGNKIITLSVIPEYGTSTIYMWDIEASQCLGILAKELGVAYDFELSIDGRLLTIGLHNTGKDFEQQIHVWDVETSKLTCSFEDSQPVTFSPDGNIIAARRIDKNSDIDFWDVKTCKLLNTLHSVASEEVVSMDFSPDGKLLVVGSNEAIQIWDVINRNLLFEFGGLSNAVKILIFSPDGRFILSETDRVTVDEKAIITLWGVPNP